MREQKTDPRSASIVLLVILLIAGALYLRLSANTARLEVPTFRSMAVSGQGDVYVVIGNTLFVESATGESLQKIDLASWGVQDFHGDMVVMADGSVVLAKGKLGEISGLEAARIVARATSVHDPRERLMRCRPESGECAELEGNDAALIGRAFGIDTDGEFLYVSEPARHRLLKLALDGEILAASESGWRFPNDARVVLKGRIGFADTNNHRYVEVSSDTETFGDLLEETDIGGWPAIVRPLRFPMEALKDESGALWMLVARENMNDAGLYRYTATEGARLLNLPANADPLDMVQMPGAILVSDTRNFRIHRFDMKGDAQAGFGSASLRTELDALRSRHDRWKLVFDASLIVVLLVAVPALVFGYRLQKLSEQEKESGPDESSTTLSVPNPAVAIKSLATQYAALNGELPFWRKHSALSTNSERWFILVLVLFPFLMLLATASLVSARAPGRSVLEILFQDRLFWITAGVFGVSFVLAWLSALKERIVITREGIRYISFLPRPLSHLFMPDWCLRWEEIREIRLEPGAMAWAPAMWRYRIFTANGRMREIKAFAWRLAGDPEIGVTLSSLIRRRLAPEFTRATLRKTMLYRMLARAISNDRSA